MVTAIPDSTTEISFLRAATVENKWLCIEVKDPAEASEAETARKQLSEYLQTILTTPNLIVLVGSGASLGRVGGPSMSDLWKNASNLPNFLEVLTLVKQQEGDEWIENLLSRCGRAKEFLGDDEAEKINAFLSASEEMIWNACSNFLKPENLECYKTFLRRMARRRLRAPRLKLFTTNYDLCLETAASSLGITVIDGFSFSQLRRFDPRFFGYDVVRRAKGSDETHDFVEGVVQLFKLHGSVNWDDTMNGIVQKTKPKKPCLIYPASTKYEQSYSQPHLELMSQFQSALREPNTCLLTVGFGFNDYHLSAPILAAVDSNPSFKLLTIDRFAKDKSEQIDSAYSGLRRRIFSGEAGITLLNAEFEQFADLIPQLHALSPAEQIERSVKQIVSDL